MGSSEHGYAPLRLARIEVILILVCVFIIIGLTYMGAGAWLRDRERRAGHGDADPPARRRDDWDD